MTTANEHGLGLERYGPVEIRRELETTNALLSTINSEVSTSNADALFKVKWGDLYRDWREFYQGKLGPAGLISHLRDSTFDRAAAYRREALKFRYALLKAAMSPRGESATPVAPAPEKGGGGGGIHLPGGGSELPDMVLPMLPSFPWRTLVYGGAAVLGGVVLIRVVRGR